MSTVTLHSGGGASSIRPGRASRRSVGRWLLCVALLVFTMVVVGGITRLTESGLSIVDWRPVSGILPPLSEADWQAAFDAYKQYPEYQIMNRGMTLSEFQTIFWWEYVHRLLGRLIGFVFAVPLVYFWMRKSIPRGYGPRLLGLLFLGGAQGLLGWFMVKSGLVDHPEVSHYRLAAHLTLAFIIFAALFWTALDLLGHRRPSRDAVLGKWGRWILLLLFLQIIMGGLVAGLKAGYTFNTWPLMEGSFIPEHYMAMTPVWQNILDNTATVQFNHRMGAYLLVILSFFLLLKTFARRAPGQVRFLAGLLFTVLCLQMTIGILTVLYAVPVALGAVHQAMALVVLAVVLMFVHRFRKTTGA